MCAVEHCKSTLVLNLSLVVLSTARRQCQTVPRLVIALVALGPNAALDFGEGRLSY